MCIYSCQNKNSLPQKLLCDYCFTNMVINMILYHKSMGDKVEREVKTLLTFSSLHVANYCVKWSCLLGFQFWKITNVSGHSHNNSVHWKDMWGRGLLMFDEPISTCSDSH